MGTVISLLLVAAFSMTAFAAETEMTGPDEVVEGSDIQINFTGPSDGGMEGTVTASDNLSFQGITPGNMSASLSDENHVFSLFGDPVEYTYNVSASAGEEVWVTLTDAEESDADSNLTQVDDQEWRQEVIAAGASSTPTSNPTGDPTYNPSQNPSDYPTYNPTQSAVPSGTAWPTAPPTPVPTNPVQPTNPTNPTQPGNSKPGAVRYPVSYAPRPAAQRTIYKSYDGMPKTGDTSTTMNYWALLTIAALLGVVVIVSATQVCAYGETKAVRTTSSSNRRHHYRR